MRDCCGPQPWLWDHLCELSWLCNIRGNYLLSVPWFSIDHCPAWSKGPNHYGGRRCHWPSRTDLSTNDLFFKIFISFENPRKNMFFCPVDCVRSWKHTRSATTNLLFIITFNPNPCRKQQLAAEPQQLRLRRWQGRRMSLDEAKKAWNNRAFCSFASAIMLMFPWSIDRLPTIVRSWMQKVVLHKHKLRPCREHMFRWKRCFEFCK